MADISTADGKCLRPEAAIKDRKSKLCWPNQPEPTQQQKADWKAALLKYVIKTASKETLILHQRLGKRVSTPLVQSWKFYYVKTNKQLWRRLERRWFLVAESRLSTTVSSIGSVTMKKLPVTACPSCDVDTDWRMTQAKN